MDQLKRLRAEKGLSQARLAAHAELDPSTVNQIERGAREASPATLRKLADALDVSLVELLEADSPKAQAPLPLEEAGRPSVFAEAVAAVAEKWLQIGPPTSPTDYGKLLGIVDAALDLEDLMGTRLGEPGWWEGLSAQEKHDFVRVDKLLTEVAGRHLARLEEGVQREEAPIDLDEFRRRKDAVAQRNRRKTATA